MAISHLVELHTGKALADTSTPLSTGRQADSSAAHHYPGGSLIHTDGGAGRGAAGQRAMRLLALARWKDARRMQSVKSADAVAREITLSQFQRAEMCFFRRGS